MKGVGGKLGRAWLFASLIFNLAIHALSFTGGFSGYRNILANCRRRA
jgi:hypothetical protein